MTSTPARVRLLAWLSLGVAALATHPTAFAQSNATPRPLGQPAPVQTFPAQGITLDEAIQLTVRFDPVLQQREADIARRRGLLQQLQGAFDARVTFDGSYTHRTSELSDSQKETEKKKRDDLDEAIRSREDYLAEAEGIRTLVNQLRSAGPGSGPLDELSRLSPTVAATVRTLDRLIESTNDPNLRAQYAAIRTSYLLDAFNEFDREVLAARTELNGLVGFRRDLGDAPVDEVFIDATAVARVSKLFRWGVELSPFFDSTFTGTNFKGKPRAGELGGKGISDVLEFRAGVDGTLPLLRGRGSRSVAAPERSAALDVEAARLALDHQSAASVLVTVQAYWGLRAAQEAATIARQAAAFQTQLTGITQQIIAVGDLPQVEIARARAAEARANADLQDAERRLHEARVALAGAMGVSVGADASSLPTAADSFPSTATGATAGAVDAALSRRQDLQAAARSVDAAAILVDGASRDLASRLDLQLGTFYTALGEGSGPKALDRWVGPSATVGVQFEKPLGNNQAQGVLAQREADAASRQIAQRDLDRQIRLGVIEATGTLQQAMARVAQAEAAVGFFETTVNAEVQRFRTGDATLFDTVLTRQQQNDAQLALVLARQDLALRLAQLRYETGTLVTAPVSPVSAR